MSKKTIWATDTIEINIWKDAEKPSVNMWGPNMYIQIPRQDLSAVIQALQEAQKFIEGAQEEI